MGYDTERVFPAKQIIDILTKWLPNIDDVDKINYILEDIEELLSMNQRAKLDRRDVDRDTTDRRGK
ncbi:hypothetical protein ACFL6E_01570 [Candidatus Neomarinimicrobiota bacterium]